MHLDLSGQSRGASFQVLYSSGYAQNLVMQDGWLDTRVELRHKLYRRADLAKKVQDVLTAQ